MTILILFTITAYHIYDNRIANIINQTLAAIKLVTYSIIALVGLIRLFTNWETSRVNWQEPLSGGNPKVTAYSAAILSVNTIFIYIYF